MVAPQAIFWISAVASGIVFGSSWWFFNFIKSSLGVGIAFAGFYTYLWPHFISAPPSPLTLDWIIACFLYSLAVIGVIAGILQILLPVGGG